MPTPDRRDLINQFKDRKVSAGIFAVRNLGTGARWLGVTQNLGSQQNGTFFELRTGSHRNGPLQAAWKAEGAEAFVYEVVEAVDVEGLVPYQRGQRLKERLNHWLASDPKAQPIVA